LTKIQDLNKTARVIEDLKSKLATLEKDLEAAKEKETILTKKLKEEEASREDAENQIEQLREALALWTDGLLILPSA
jgi:chromosome segregation ATPase